jgi:hypothetical protein
MFFARIACFCAGRYGYRLKKKKSGPYLQNVTPLSPSFATEVTPGLHLSIVVYRIRILEFSGDGGVEGFLTCQFGGVDHSNR